jgi:lon-related putative ATP-dependent protease
MAYEKELTGGFLKNGCDPAKLPFDSTSELEPYYGIIGQERAARAMEFGLNIRMKGYNLYLSGASGTGKTSYANSYITKVAEELPTPDDWCYVYNFINHGSPTAINLPAGQGRIFRDDMDNFIKVLKIELSKAFDSEDYEKEKTAIIKEFQETRSELLGELSGSAEKHGFKVKTTNAGIYFVPVIDGKVIDEEEYGDLDEKVRHDLSEKSNQVQMETLDIIRRIKDVEKKAETKVEEWENKIALFAVGAHIIDLKEKYSKYEKITCYLEKVQEDILKNLNAFIGEETPDNVQQLVIPWMKREAESPADKYKVNLLVNNSGLKGAPVILDYNPTYYNLLGKIEYENEFGAVTTDFTLVKAGLLHQANGGYIILQARDVLNNVQSWEALKRVLRSRHITIENIKEQMGLVAVSSLKPEPIPIDVKVVLVGSAQIYQLLYELDDDFSKLFKIKVDFDDEMDRTEENILKLSRFVSSFCSREKTLHFDRGGIAKIVDYASRLVEDQQKLTTRFNDLAEIMCEACTWAELDGARYVGAVHVKRAVAEKKHRSDKYDERLLELIKEGTIMIDTEGEVTGQINGLSILDMGDYSFGKPSRITAATYMGESGIVNIEREIEMSGTSHSKGVLILNGYIGQKYAQKMPLSLSASLCFEQLYGGVDGDSASSAELYAILSSLAETPIKQSIAVTGSVNQRGEIQPIGGATRKIEGFFELCRLRGLDGSHGVIIPHQNVKNLVLDDEVVDAVREGKFHIYPVSTIDEGMEILTGVRAGARKKDGTYPLGTINYKVYKKLERFALTVVSFGKIEPQHS